MVSTRCIDILHEDDGIRIEEDTNLFGSGYVKRSYLAWRENFQVKTPPRSFNTSLTLVPFPLGTKPWYLTTLDRDGKPQTQVLKPHHYTYLPPKTAFVLAIDGAGVLQLYAPVIAGIKGMDETSLPPDFFDRLQPAPPLNPKGHVTHGPVAPAHTLA